MADADDGVVVVVVVEAGGWIGRPSSVVCVCRLLCLSQLVYGLQRMAMAAHEQAIAGQAHAAKLCSLWQAGSRVWRWPEAANDN